MYKLILQFSKKIVENIAELDEVTLTLPPQLIYVMKLLQSLLDLTYLRRKEGTYIFLLSILVRPQLYFNTDIIQYFFLSLHLIYLIVIFVKIPKRKIFALHGILMRTNYLNFCLEISYFPICLISQPLSIMISAFNQFILLEALDVQIKNFQQTKVRNIFNLIFLLQIIISLIDFYNVQKLCIYVLIILRQVLSWIHSNNDLETAIHIYTIFITTCEIFQIAEQSSFIIIFPLLYKIHSRFKYQSQTEQEILPNSNDPKEKIIYISHLIIGKQYLKSLQQLSSLQFTNIILNTKKEILKKRCIKQILMNLQGESKLKTNFLDSFKKIIESEEQFIQMQTALKQLITEKMILLKNFRIEKFQLFFKFLEKMNKFEKQLIQMSLDNPNTKLRKILLFYFSEISNDFHQARIYSHQNKEVQVEEFERYKLSYIMAVYNTQLEITGVSKNTFSQNDGVFSIEKYIPSGIQEFHRILVDEFIEKGQSKLVEKFDSVFMMKEYDKVMTSVDFGLIVNATDKLQFVAFFQPSSEQKMAMILDSFFQITCISESLANFLNISFFDQKYLGINISTLIPKFQENMNYQEDLDLIISQDSEETVYLVTINLISRVIENDRLYSILYFPTIRRQAKQKTITQSQYYNVLDPTSFNFETKRYTEEEIVIYFNVPQEDQVNVPYDQQSNHQLSIQCMKQEAIFDENKILESPISYQQKLIMKPTLSTKLRKQQSQNIEEDNLRIDQSQQENEGEKKTFLQDFYKQEIHSINKFYLLLIFSLFVACLIYIYQTIKLNQDIQQLVYDIDILDFAQLCFQPLENNLLIIFSISEYQLYYVMKFITGQQFLQLVQFPSEQVVIGYNEIFNNFNSLFSQNIFQSILDENTIQIYQYTNSTSLDSYNVTLRKAFGILLEFQYDGLLDFQKNGRVSSDTSHIYYLFKNYIPLKTLVTNLNSQLLDQTIVITEQHQDFVFYLLIISLFVVSIPYLLSYFYFIKITELIDCYYNLLLQIPQYLKEAQITTLKYFISQISQDCDFILKYKYCEKKFRNDRSNQNQKRPKTSNNLKFSAMSWKLGYIILYSIILTKSGITYYLSKKYFQGYSEVAKFYISLSDLSISISSMYSAREVLYFRTSFPYLENETIEYLMNLIEYSLNDTQNFLENEAIQAISNNVIVTEAFSQYYETILKENLCAQLNSDLLNSTQSFCVQLFGGNMKKGLIAVLNGIVNSLKTEMNFDQFTQRYSIQLYDLEGPFLISQIISQLFHNMRENLLIETQQIVEIVNLISIILLCVLTVVVLFSKKIIFNSIRMKLEISKRFISFIPIKMLLLDEGLERYVKNLMYKNNIQ